jgi:hypothetical protein
MSMIIVVEVNADRDPKHLIEQVSRIKGRRACGQEVIDGRAAPIMRANCVRFGLNDCPPLLCKLCQERVVHLINFWREHQESQP